MNSLQIFYIYTNKKHKIHNISKSQNEANTQHKHHICKHIYDTDITQSEMVFGLLPTLLQTEGADLIKQTRFCSVYGALLRMSSETTFNGKLARPRPTPPPTQTHTIVSGTNTSGSHQVCKDNFL